jgi:prophage regulatory protein
MKDKQPALEPVFLFLYFPPATHQPRHRAGFFISSPPSCGLFCARRNDMADNAPRRFIKLSEVKALTTLSTSEIYRRIAAGTFPAQVTLGPKSVVWIEAEVLAWCEARIASSRGETA